jgi:formiminotetrahydrofolate cyclodeaminase
VTIGGDTRLAELLERMAVPEPGPATGTALATTLAMCAALVARGARASGEWDAAGGAAAQALALRRRALELAGEAADAYAAAVRLLRAPTDDLQLASALERAAHAPLEIGAVAADVAALASYAAQHVADDVRPDVTAAAHLAAAASREAAGLVAVNLGVTDDDVRRADSEATAAVAEAAAATARRPAA